MSEPADAIRSTCPYCGVGCGVLALPDGRVVGDPEHPANNGRLCAKGATLGETLGDRGRLVRPRVDGRDADWDTAMRRVAEGFGDAISRFGPDSVAFYLSGQFLTEDYYAANKLMKGFIGAANIDTNSRLCMASSVAGHVRGFGEDVVPGTYEDWSLAELAVLVGSNSAWCHPVLHARLAGREMRMAVIDPRRTATAADATQHLAVRPGSDVALFNGLLCFIVDQGATDNRFIADHTNGFAEAVAAARASGGGDLDMVAEATGVPPAELRRFFRLWVDTERVMTVYSQGVNQSTAGTDKVNAILNCHLATGRIGKPGTGPFSITGQPNAMGGREVGGLANQLAAHMQFEPAALDRVGRFWNAPLLARKPGLKAVELFEAVADGRIRAIWIAATNPAASMPRADSVRESLRRCPLVVAADCWDTDTTDLAHVVLPAAGWGEKDGTVTNSERRISRQRRFRDAPGEAKPDWWMFRELAHRLGHGDAFAWDGPAAIFSEHARLSAFENDGKRRFDIGALADRDYDALEPVHWPLGGGDDGEGRLFGDGRFSTPDRRARFMPTTPRGLAAATSDAFPLLLNTGRLRDQWHTMSRTGLVPQLALDATEPLLRISPSDAARGGIQEGALVRLRTPYGGMLAAATVAEDQPAGSLFLPIHWTDKHNAAGPVGRLVGNPVDPVSGQPELKATPAAMPVAVPLRWHATMVQMFDRLAPAGGDATLHWSRFAVGNGQAWRLRRIMAAGNDSPGRGNTAPDDPPLPANELLRDMLAALVPRDADARAVWQANADKTGLAGAVIRGTAIVRCFAAATTADALPDAAVLANWLDAGWPDNDDDAEDLLDRIVESGGAGQADRIVCACRGIRESALRTAIAEQDLRSTTAVEHRTGAGGGCGACRREIGAILCSITNQPEQPDANDQGRDSMTDASFTAEQQDYLKGFMAGVEARRSVLGLPLAPLGGGSTTDVPRDEQDEAWARTIAAGGKLTAEETGKRQRHPLDRFDELAARAADNKFPRGVDVFLTKWQGLFYVAPNQNSFMCRLRMPGGILQAHQLRGLAELSERCAGGYADITTRANLQLREIPADKAVEVLWALADLGLTSRGAGGDNVRNVTGSPTAGIDPLELIDTRPMARAIHHWILNHRALYGLPRKFNIAFDGGGHVPVLEDTNDIAFTAVRIGDGASVAPGIYFRLELGGITGHRDFARPTGVLVAPDDTTAVCDAILRVFIREGDRTDRKRARLKYVLDSWGMDRFLQAVETQLGRPLARVPSDQYVMPERQDRSGHLGAHGQKQLGLSYLGVLFPLGRMTADQMRGLATIADRHGSGELRLTVWQNLLIPGIRNEDLPAVQEAVRALGLDWQATPLRAGLVSCTGAAGCRFAASHTKQHASALVDWLEPRISIAAPLNIHLTGCHNSCAQHFIADIGLIGAKVERGEDMVEGYDLHVGGGAGPDARIGRLLKPGVAHDELGPIVLGLLRGWTERAPELSFQDFSAGLDDDALLAFCEPAADARTTPPMGVS